MYLVKLRESAGNALTEEQEQEQLAIVLSDSIKQYSAMDQAINVHGAANFLVKLIKIRQLHLGKVGNPGTNDCWRCGKITLGFSSTY